MRVVRRIGDLNRKATVVETDLLTIATKTRAAKLGLSETGIPFLNVTNVTDPPQTSTVRIIDNRVVQFFTGSKEAGIISLPLVKATDTGPGLTCATKNLFGLACARNKARLHKYLPHVLRKICRIYKGKVYTIVDGRCGMEGKGSPVKGKVVIFDPEFWIGGSDFLEIDSILERSFFPSSTLYRSILECELPNDLDNTDLITRNRILHPATLDPYKRLYYWAWENLDHPLLKPILRWRKTNGKLWGQGNCRSLQRSKKPTARHLISWITDNRRANRAVFVSC